jgi:hypothetical protein
LYLYICIVKRAGFYDSTSLPSFFAALKVRAKKVQRWIPS